MPSRIALSALIALCFLAGCQPDTAAVPETGARPNILLIMADDLGVNDLGVQHAGKPVTPTLDQLGDTGLRFQRHYTDTSCAPSRVALLTGQHPARHGFNPINIGISPEVETLPELLRQKGYGTHHVGKWHAGSRHPLAWPLQQGFDSFFGFLDQFQLSNPDHIHQGGGRRPRYHNPWLQEGNALPQIREGHLTDLLGEAARERIQQLAATPNPWFLNLWFLAPHTPIQPSEEYARQFPDTDEGHYLALIAHMDDQIRRVIETLKTTGQYDNTLIVFLSDNGGTNQTRDSNYPYQGSKAHASEGAMRTPLILHWPKNLAVGLRDDISTQPDVFATLLGVADIAIPDTSDGIDLLHHAPTPSRTLFWESDNWYGLSQSLLAANGKWRLDNGELQILEGNATPSTTDIKALNTAYQDWRQQALQVPFQYEKLSPQGHARLSGHSFLRAPGYQGFTLKLAFRVDALNSNETSTLLYQNSWWHIWLDDQGHLHVQIPDIQLQSPSALELGRCHELIVSTFYARQLINPSQEMAMGALLLNGAPLAQAHTTDSTLIESGWLEPTWIGMRGDGSARLQGWISTPVLRKEYLTADISAPPEKQTTLLPALCENQTTP